METRKMTTPKMKNLKLRTDGNAVRTFKQLLLAISLAFISLPLLISFFGGKIFSPAIATLTANMFLTGASLLMAFGTAMALLSKYSPVRWLAVRKKLILFTRLFINPKTDGTLYQSVRWQYAANGKNTIIDLYPNGLVGDTAGMGMKLSQYFGENLLKYEETDSKARYILGNPPKRYDGIGLMEEGSPEPESGGSLSPDYEPIPIYGNVCWDIGSEALHILLTAPSGAGKTMFLHYLAGMVLKRMHKLYVIDAKNSDFGRMFRHSGVTVATDTEEIIRLLASLVQEMEERYAKYFASGKGSSIESLGLKMHFLFFDEILSVLSFASRKEREEIEKLLGQLALKGRAAGFSLVVSAQKLNATSLPKSITEQCQTRIILGGLVSEETFHQATGAYKKDIAAAYKGGVGEGYAVTPRTGGLAYIKTPRMPQTPRKSLNLLAQLKDREARCGEGR